MWILGERLERTAICFLLVVKLRHVSVLKVAWNDRMQGEIKRKKVRNINWRVARAGGKENKKTTVDYLVREIPIAYYHRRNCTPHSMFSLPFCPLLLHRIIFLLFHL